MLEVQCEVSVDDVLDFNLLSLIKAKLYIFQQVLRALHPSNS